MDLQTAFYIIGIISMVLWVIILLTVLIVIWKVRRSVDNFKKGFKENIVSLVKERNVEVASALGLTVAHFIVDKIKKGRK